MMVRKVLLLILNIPKTTLKKQKSSIKFKSKNKITYNFEDGQSVQINP